MSLFRDDLGQKFYENFLDYVRLRNQGNYDSKNHHGLYGAGAGSKGKDKGERSLHPEIAGTCGDQLQPDKRV